MFIMLLLLVAHRGDFFKNFAAYGIFSSNITIRYIYVYKHRFWHNLHYAVGLGCEQVISLCSLRQMTFVVMK